MTAHRMDPFTTLQQEQRQHTLQHDLVTVIGPSTPSSSCGLHHVVAVAFGTRGDVQPIALLADQMGWTCPAALVTLITHSCHQGWVDTLGLRLHFTGLHTAPARVWRLQDDSSGNAHEELPQQEPTEDWDAVLRACCDALGCSSLSATRTDDGSRPTPSAKCVGHASNALIIFNLFALEAFHISEALQVPCVAAAPYAIPYTMPASFRRCFAAVHPSLYKALHGAGGGSVSWSEVQHWMWPLFTERWQTWRGEVLKLPALPFAKASYAWARYGGSQAEPGGEDDSSAGLAVNAVLPPATPLLYGFSEHIVPRPNYYPPSVHVCGFWLPSEAPNARVVDVINIACNGMPLAGAATMPVCIDFGSMGRMGLIPNPKLLLHVVAQALASVDMHGIVLAGGWQPLQHAYNSLKDPPALKARLTLVMDSLPHGQLLRHCCAFVHHGGSGNTAAALAAGTPQVFAPLMFDQHYWAERLAYMDLAPAPCNHQLLLGAAPAPDTPAAIADEGSMDSHQLQTACAALHQRLLFALAPGTRQRCREVAQVLSQEDGLAKAVSIMLVYIDRENASLEQQVHLPLTLTASHK